MGMKVPYKKNVLNAQIDYEKLIYMQANTECQYNDKKRIKAKRKTRSNKRIPNARRGV